MIPLSVSRQGNPDNPAVVLIHGWGSRGAIWAAFAELLLAREYAVYRVDLPGYGNGYENSYRNSYENSDASTQQRWQPEILTAALEASLAGQGVEQALLFGWSLGGQIAALYAHRYPQRASGLITLCSNPVFVAQDDWPSAMPPDTFADFAHTLEQSPGAALTKFQWLQTQGSDSAKSDLRWLKQQLNLSSVTLDTLQQSLQFLATQDTREILKQLPIPQLHLFGSQDQLVPAAAASTVSNLGPHIKTAVIPGAAHLPFHSHTEQVLSELKDWRLQNPHLQGRCFQQPATHMDRSI